MAFTEMITELIWENIKNQQFANLFSICISVNDAPKILYNFGEFADTGGHNVLRNDPNSDKDSNPIMWTNFVAYTVIKTEIHAKYLQPDDRGDTHYVRGFKVGVIEEKVTLSYYKGLYINNMWSRIYWIYWIVQRYFSQAFYCRT